MVLGRREDALLAVDRAPSRGEDEAPDAVPDAVLEETDRPEDVHVGVVVRLGDGASDVDLRSLVAHRLRPEPPHDIPASRADVGLVEGSALRHVGATPAREVVGYR